MKLLCIFKHDWEYTFPKRLRSLALYHVGWLPHSFACGLETTWPDQYIKWRKISDRACLRCGKVELRSQKILDAAVQAKQKYDLKIEANRKARQDRANEARKIIESENIFCENKE